MGKNHSKKKKQKPFNPIRNVDKLQELRPKLSKLESDNNGRGSKASTPLSEEKNKGSFSEKDREIVLSIREMFPKDGQISEYREEFNLIRVPIEGDYDTHPLLIKCNNSVLSIFSAKVIDAKNSSEKALKHIMNLNFTINMGGFHYITERDCFMFKMSVPLCEKPEKAFLGGLLKYAIDILDDYVPEIISCIHGANHWKKEGISPTFH